jgi:hypothetical protein
MASKIAKGTASTGPDDSLIAVDANGTTTDMVLSKVLSTSNTVGGTIIDTAKKTALDPKALAKAISVEDGKFSLSTKSLKDIMTKGLLKKGLGARVGGVAGPNLTGIPGLSKTQTGLAEKYLGELIGSDNTDLVNKAGKLFKIGNGIDTSSASGLMKGIAKLADFPDFANIADQHSFTASALAYLDTAISMGIPDAIDVLLGKIKDDKLKRKRILANVRGAVLRADIPIIKKIISYIGARAVVDQVPDACVYILAAYNFPRGTLPKDYPGLRAELLGLLEELDSEWDRERRNGVLVSKLDPFTRISRAAKSILQLQPDYDVPMAMALTYKKVDLNAVLKKSYPLMVKL